MILLSLGISTKVIRSAHICFQSCKDDTDTNHQFNISGINNRYTNSTSVLTHLNSTKTAQSGKKFVVPNLVHFIWFYDKNTTFRFHMFISVLSAYKFIQPSTIVFWYSNEPSGYWWSELRKRVPDINMRYKEPPTSIYGINISKYGHKSDVASLQILTLYGGIYMDLDMVILKSLDPLRVYNTTVGRATFFTLSNGLIISKPDAEFLNIWHSSYKTFDDSKWVEHSAIIPFKLSRKHPDSIHVEDRKLQRPNWSEKEWIFGKKIYNLTENYSLNLAYRFYNIDHNQDDIKHMDSTAGNVFRYIYYGTNDIFTPKIIVPQTVHLVWSSNDTFSYHHYMQLVAIKKYVNCTQILIWYEMLPSGDWWNRSMSMVILRSLSEFSSFLYPVEILYKYGGLYLNWNMFPVNSFTSLFYYNVTLALEGKQELSSKIMAAIPGSEFFEILLKELKMKNTSSTLEKDGQLLTQLYKDKCPHLVHLEHRISFEAFESFKAKRYIAYNVSQNTSEVCMNETMRYAKNDPICSLYRYIESTIDVM